MKTTLLKLKLFKTVLAVMGLLLTGSVFGQTIGAGQTVLASSLGANPTVTIQANGTLDMDIAKTFTAITTSGSGVSTISGLGAVTVNNAITLGAGGASGASHTLDEWYDPKDRDKGLKRGLLVILGMTGLIS